MTTKYFNDGFSTTFKLGASDSSTVTHLYEKEVTPPGYDGGGMIDITTMHNTKYRTRSPKSLLTVTEITVTAAYSATSYTALLSDLLVNQQITVTFPDASTVVFYGWLDSFKPGANKEGEMPTAEVTIIPSNQNAGVETAPAITAH